MTDISVDIALEKFERGEVVLLDVRSPQEFAQGHIPGACNLPLFLDQERAEVGTLYVKRSREAAIERGLDFVGPRMSQLLTDARKIASGKGIVLYCWRGGMRSASVAWLLDMAGLSVERIVGGYKAFRANFPQMFQKYSYRFVVLGGPTGSGKTELLEILKGQGEEVIDLEDLANHRGSAFGAIGQEPQPTTEHFMNLLHMALRRCNADKPIWIESESVTIGRAFLPEYFHAHMLDSPMILLKVPRENRVEHIQQEYGKYSHEALKESFGRISKRIGYDSAKLAQEAIDRDDILTAIDIALLYYDKTYYNSLSTHWSKPAAIVFAELGEDRCTLAKRIMASARAIGF